MARAVEIRRIEKLDEIDSLIDVQKEIWGFDELNITAPELIIVHAKLGGVVLGAFNQDNKMVGFVYSFPAEKGGELMQWSHMLAVLPDYRGTGLGKRLKWRQREETLKREMDLCCWTFDPLQTVISRFNIVSLGARANEYIVNAYGMRNGNFDAGLPTDRFVARWDLNHQRALDCIDGRPRRAAGPPQDISCALKTIDDKGILLPSGPDVEIDDELVSVDVPLGMNRLRKANLDASMRWRQATREVFTAYFKRGYYLVDILTPAEAGNETFLYILRKEEN